MDKEIKSAFVGVTILSILAILAIVFVNPLLGETLHVDKGIYHVVYDTTLEQPLRVSYKVTNRQKNADRKGMNFKKEPNIHTSDDKDYVNNVWDKGHMAPAAHFSDSEENLRLTFSYLNSALQHEKLNRGPWKNLEKYERKLSKKYTVQVKVVLEFDANSLLLETGALVPSYFIKILSYNDIVRVFRFPNNISTYNQIWHDYEVQSYEIIMDFTEVYNR